MKTLPWILIIVLMALLFLQRECHHCPECEPVAKVDTTKTVRVDSFAYPVSVYKPMAVPANNFIFAFGSRLSRADSLKIFNVFFSRYYYIDTLVNDTNALLILEDSVYQNQIVWRKKTFQIFPKTVFQTRFVNVAADPSRKFFAGVGVGRKPTEFSLSPSLMYISKRENAYTLSYDLINQDIYFTIFWKIKFHR